MTEIDRGSKPQEFLAKPGGMISRTIEKGERIAICNSPFMYRWAYLGIYTASAFKLWEYSDTRKEKNSLKEKGQSAS